MRSSRFLLRAAIALACAIGLTGATSAGPGVGVNLGSISVDDLLSPGGGYELPAIGVINTGAEVANYALNVTHTADQLEQRPEAAWFSFDPAVFPLAPGQAETVNIRLSLPSNVPPGEYYAHLEARPIQSGDDSIGVAAATRISFTVEESSWLNAQRRQLNRWLDDYGPWTYAAPLAIAVLILTHRLGRGFRFRLPFERR